FLPDGGGGLPDVLDDDVLVPGLGVPAGLEHRRGDALDYVAQVSGGGRVRVDRVDGRANGSARAVAEQQRERDREHVDAELDRPEHRRVDDVAGVADHEEVAEALVKDDLGGDARVRAAEYLGERVLVAGELGATVGVLVLV